MLIRHFNSLQLRHYLSNYVIILHPPLIFRLDIVIAVFEHTAHQPIILFDYSHEIATKYSTHLHNLLVPFANDPHVKRALLLLIYHSEDFAYGLSFILNFHTASLLVEGRNEKSFLSCMTKASLERGWVVEGLKLILMEPIDSAMQRGAAKLLREFTSALPRSKLLQQCHKAIWELCREFIVHVRLSKPLPPTPQQQACMSFSRTPTSTWRLFYKQHQCEESLCMVMTLILLRSLKVYVSEQRAILDYVHKSGSLFYTSLEFLVCLSYYL